RKSLRADTEEEARRKLRKALSERDDGLPVPDDKLTLKGYLHDWLAEARRARERRATTLRGYSVNVDHICASSIAIVPLSRLRPTHIKTLRQELAAKGLGGRSVTYVIAVLRVALGDAVELELLTRNPAQVSKRVGRKRAAQHESTFEVVPLTTEQVEAVFAAV